MTLFLIFQATKSRLNDLQLLFKNRCENRETMCRRNNVQKIVLHLSGQHYRILLTPRLLCWPIVMTTASLWRSCFLGITLRCGCLEKKKSNYWTNFQTTMQREGATIFSCDDLVFKIYTNWLLEAHLGELSPQCVSWRNANYLLSEIDLQLFCLLWV